jgi:hypothetical protein
MPAILPAQCEVDVGAQPAAPEVELRLARITEVPVQPEVYGPQPVRGYTRVAVRIAWWNIFHLGVLIIWTLLLCSDQGAELLAMKGGIGLMLLGAVLYFAVLAWLSSFVAARWGDRQLQRLVVNYGIDLPLVRRLSQVYAPTFFATAPLVALGIATDRRTWYLAAFITAFFAFDLARRYARTRREGPRPESFGYAFTKYWLWIALLVWAIALAGSSTASRSCPRSRAPWARLAWRSCRWARGALSSRSCSSPCP